MSEPLTPDEMIARADHRTAPISRPVVGAAGKTGAWRVFRPVIDYSKCIKCYMCWMYCPDIAVKVPEIGEFPRIDYDYCKGCGICSEVCPRGAIKMVRELE